MRLQRCVEGAPREAARSLAVKRGLWVRSAAVRVETGAWSGRRSGCVRPLERSGQETLTTSTANIIIYGRCPLTRECTDLNQPLYINKLSLFGFRRLSYCFPYRHWRRDLRQFDLNRVNITIPFSSG